MCACRTRNFRLRSLLLFSRPFQSTGFALQAFLFCCGRCLGKKTRVTIFPFVCVCSPTLKKGFDDQHSGFLRAMKLQVRFAVLLSAIPSASVESCCCPWNLAPIHLSKRHQTFSVFVPYMLFAMLQVDQALKTKSNHTTALSDI